jgi:DNA-binding CsgD family transcriptional regulator
MSHKPPQRWVGGEQLSKREREVLTLTGEGLDTKQIAETLGISASTIDTYRERLKTKLELNSGNALLRHAVILVTRRDDAAK